MGFEKTECDNGDIIYTDGFDVEGFELFFSEYVTTCGSGYNRFYIAKDNDVYDDGEILIYSNKDGWTGTWGDDVGLAISQFYGCNGFGDEYEHTIANDYFEIDEDEIFDILNLNKDDYSVEDVSLAFRFCDLEVLKVDDEYILCAKISIRDEIFILDINNKKNIGVQK